MLLVDMVLYFLLTIYLENVIQGEYGTAKSLLFFLYPSYWSEKREKAKTKLSFRTPFSESSSGKNEFELQEDICEEVPPEFADKIGIR